MSYADFPPRRRVEGSGRKMRRAKGLFAQTDSFFYLTAGAFTRALAVFWNGDSFIWIRWEGI